MVGDMDMDKAAGKDNRAGIVDNRLADYFYLEK
jgi:hypothetical protein